MFLIRYVPLPLCNRGLRTPKVYCTSMVWSIHICICYHTWKGKIKKVQFDKQVTEHTWLLNEQDLYLMHFYGHFQVYNIDQTARMLKIAKSQLARYVDLPAYCPEGFNLFISVCKRTYKTRKKPTAEPILQHTSQCFAQAYKEWLCFVQALTNDVSCQPLSCVRYYNSFCFASPITLHDRLGLYFRTAVIYCCLNTS